MNLTATGSRIDWHAERDQIDLAGVIVRELNRNPEKKGSRLWWSCPFHEDNTPSFWIKPRGQTWKCYACGEYGDAVSLVMRLRGMSFPEAIAHLTGRPAPTGKRSPRPSSAKAPVTRPPRPDDGPAGMSEADALALVESAATRLWTPAGAAALATLRDRGLEPEAIRAARLGYVDCVQARTRDGRPYHASGIVIPWWRDGHLSLVKVRQPEGREPKYAEVYRHRPSLYVASPIRPGHPVVLAEGEFDAILLAQELGEHAAVVTLGSASGRPTPNLVSALACSPTWLIAHDADPAGDKAAESWTAYPRARRVRPPEGMDWSDLHGQAFNAIRYRLLPLVGRKAPTWDELATWQWGSDDGNPIAPDANDRYDETEAAAANGRPLDAPYCR